MLLAEFALTGTQTTTEYVVHKTAKSIDPIINNAVLAWIVSTSLPILYAEEIQTTVKSLIAMDYALFAFLDSL